MSRRSFFLFAALALVGAFVITRGLIQVPGYTDVYYHLNAANHMASGQGLTDAYVWTYIGALDRLPMPSHLYWMPLTSVIAGVSMSLFNAPGDYAVAQIPFTLLFAATACVGFWLGGRIGGTARHAWVAGLLTLFSGFFVKFWGEIDTFAPYALVGAAGLLVMGVGAGLRTAPTDEGDRAHRRALLRRYFGVWFAAGALAGLGHLTRADGLLLLIVGGIVIVWAGAHRRAPLRANHEQAGGGHGSAVPLRTIIVSLAALLAGYALVMLPYFARNLSEIGTPLPLGGTQAIWFREYDDIFNYPPDSSPAALFAGGLDAFINSRSEALVNNVGTFVAVEGLVVMTPLMLIGWWQRRRNAFLLPFGLYALGLHLAMTFVFPFPGYRGGLLHSAAALVPFWGALGAAGLDDVVEWAARRRRRWHAGTAKVVFSGGLVAVAVGLSVYIGVNGRVAPRDPAIYAELRALLPPDARILSDDPPEVYYYTGMGGATLPNEPPETLLDVARRYDIDYLLLKHYRGSIPAPLQVILDAPPDFLEPLPFDSARLYVIHRSP
ncbi:MAG: hypothetical protein IT319_03765 [Anaerolineae bacterium]|nr:hypothetical protein [Anaerolineae bacterium]